MQVKKDLDFRIAGSLIMMNKDGTLWAVAKFQGQT